MGERQTYPLVMHVTKRSRIFLANFQNEINKVALFSVTVIVAFSFIKKHYLGESIHFYWKYEALFQACGFELKKHAHSLHLHLWCKDIYRGRGYKFNNSYNSHEIIMFTKHSKNYHNEVPLFWYCYCPLLDFTQYCFYAQIQHLLCNFHQSFIAWSLSSTHRHVVTYGYKAIDLYLLEHIRKFINATRHIIVLPLDVCMNTLFCSKTAKNGINNEGNIKL